MSTTGVFTNAARLSELQMAFAGAEKISVGFDPTGRIGNLADVTATAVPEQTVDAETTFSGLNF